MPVSNTSVISNMCRKIIEDPSSDLKDKFKAASILERITRDRLRRKELRPISKRKTLRGQPDARMNELLEHAS